MSHAESHTNSQTDAFEDLRRTVEDQGPEALMGRLVALVESNDQPRALLDALLLRARRDLELPPVAPAGLADLPEPIRTRYEDRYIEALRTVGHRLLDAGDLMAAWPYFRVLGEKEPMAEALERFEPNPEGDEQLGPIVEIAFHQGAHPRRGFELILKHYGICSAITAFEHLPQDEKLRTSCAEQLTRALHDQLVFSLRTEIERREGRAPEGVSDIPGLLADRPWLFEEEAYHIDTSHLSSVVRMAPLVGDRDVLALSYELTDYGRRLSERYQFAGEPPFENLYEDTRLYIGALLDIDADAAVQHFMGKLNPPDPDGDDPIGAVPAQVVVGLLARIERPLDAARIAGEHLSRVPENMLFCPSLPRLYLQAGRPDLLAEHARKTGDLPLYAAALLEMKNQPTGDNSGDHHDERSTQSRRA